MTSTESSDIPTPPSQFDFAADPRQVRAVASGARLRHAYQHNPRFATETARIDPLPHQRTAVYDRMLDQPQLRFLLADDAGAGKTIMTGLYIREMLSRRRLRRILIVPPAGLVGNWKRELHELFSLDFRIATGSDSREGNPFTGDDSDQRIISVDTLAASNSFERLQSSEVPAYDLVVFDEAHKLSARQRADGSVRKTKRYQLAEGLAGVPGIPERWQLNWSAHHLLLLTATPHQGKHYPYYALWRLLEPEVLGSPKAFDDYPQDARQRHFIRRAKEQMVDYDGEPIFPTRVSKTLNYSLTPDEQALYDRTTEYLEEFYNKAKILNDEAIHLAKCVFQRRLVSSTHALRASLMRRRERLTDLLKDVERAQESDIDLSAESTDISDELRDMFVEATADEEQLGLPGHEFEQNERAEHDIIDKVRSTDPQVLADELEVVGELISLADDVLQSGDESKFEKLTAWLDSEEFGREKLLVFTEHRDTLQYLKRRLEGLGYTGKITVIHGGMNYRDRDAAVENFRIPVDDGGAQLMLATDAAGEGINLQFCWQMINYDIPWNPARLEQRMGRLHRYGQEHDPVQIFNLVSSDTREGHVQKILTEKLDKIRDEFGSDRVFDVIGEVLEDAGIDDLLRLARDESVDPDDAFEDVDEDQVQRLAEQREQVYEDADDPSAKAEEYSQAAHLEKARHLLPAHVSKYVQRSAPLLQIEISGGIHDYFQLRPARPHALDQLWNVIEAHPERARERMTVHRPDFGEEAIWMRPGEAVFDRLMTLVDWEFEESALCGGVFEDPTAAGPHLVFLFAADVLRRADESFAAYRHRSTVRRKLFGVRAAPGEDLKLVDPMRWRLYKPSDEHPVTQQQLLAGARELFGDATHFARNRIAASLASEARTEIEERLEERIDFIERGFRLREAELAERRVKLKKKVDDGRRGARARFARVKNQQAKLHEHKRRRLAAVRREPELIEPGTVEHIASAMVLPTERDEDARRHRLEIEQIAMECATAIEIDAGRTPHDVSTAELATDFGFPDWPGFDLYSVAPDGSERAIEVKGRSARGDIEFSDNEHDAAVNRDDFWVYVVYDCRTSNPVIYRFRPEPSDFEATRFKISSDTVQRKAASTPTPRISNG